MTRIQFLHAVYRTIADRRIIAARRGTTSLELALIFPFMMVLFFGCVETTQLVRVFMGLGVGTQAMADLLSHGDPDTAAQVSDACNGAKLVMAPFSAGTFKAAISSVANTAGVIAINWVDVTCGTATPMLNAISLGSAMVPNAGDQVIIVQTSYVYTAATSYVLPASYTLSQLAYARPRL